jgi:hypothetical protein
MWRTLRQAGGQRAFWYGSSSLHAIAPSQSNSRVQFAGFVGVVQQSPTNEDLVFWRSNLILWCRNYSRLRTSDQLCGSSLSVRKTSHNILGRICRISSSPCRRRHISLRNLGISIPWVATIQIAVPDGNSRRILKTREEARIKSPTSSHSFTLFKMGRRK